MDRTITQFTKIDPADLRPGHVLVYGLLLAKHKRAGGYELVFPHTASVFLPDGEATVVLCATPQSFAESIARGIIKKSQNT